MQKRRDKSWVDRYADQLTWIRTNLGRGIQIGRPPEIAVER
jgi:hypothetical protein